MKNKRWKRKAKRIKGTCIENVLCYPICEFSKCCPRLNRNILTRPDKTPIRKLENYYRENKGRGKLI